MRKAEKQKRSEMINEVENTIISVCKNIQQEKMMPELHPKTVTALAELVRARAALR